MKKSKLLLVSFVLGLLYVIYLIMYFSGALAGTEGAEQVGAGIATFVVFPHFICVALATLFNGIGWAMNSKGFALTGGILYVVSMILFPLYFLFVIIQAILSFIGYAKIGKIKTQS